MNNKSFTLIELLVVIAIIGLLSSIILVSLSGTRDRAQITKTLLYSSQIYHSLGADIVGNWTFNEGSGTTARDSSGYNNTGTIYGGATYTSDTPHKAAGQGSGKYALSFDGTDDYVNCGSGSSLQNMSAITVEAWFKIATKSMPQAHRMIFTFMGLSYLSLYQDNNAYPLFSLNIGGAQRTLSSGFSPSINTWYHVVGTWDGTTMRIYVDGAQKSSAGPYTGTLDLGTGAKHIGRYSSSDYYFNGLIDEIRIYTRALTAAEIQQHYATGLEKHKDLAIK